MSQLQHVTTCQEFVTRIMEKTAGSVACIPDVAMELTSDMP
jgi:hypothetical protein